MTARRAFRQSDLTRAVKAMEQAGLAVCGVEVNDNGFRVLVGETAMPKRRNRADELYGPQA